MLDFQEFIASFKSYTADDDSRAVFANALVGQKPASVMAMSATDFAAIVSFAVSAEFHPVVVGKLRDCHEDDAAALAELDEIISRHPPEFAIDPRHRKIERMFLFIKKSKNRPP